MTTPLQNRVRPDGEIISHPARGLMMGNRGGQMHDPETRTLLRTQSSRQWICCVLDFKQRQRTVMGPGYTELFFLDEVTALAAGHRPCFECRRADAKAFAAHWQASQMMAIPPTAGHMDAELSPQRRGKGNQTRAVRPSWTSALAKLPDATMVRINRQMAALRHGQLLVWSPAGYEPGLSSDPDLQVEVLTPRTITAILRDGYQPVWHSSADQWGT